MYIHLEYEYLCFQYYSYVHSLAVILKIAQCITIYVYGGPGPVFQSNIYHNYIDHEHPSIIYMYLLVVFQDTL